MDLTPVFASVQELLKHGQYRWIAAAVLAAAGYSVFMSFRYGRLSRDAARTPHIAPLEIKGGLAATLGAERVSLMLRSELAAVSHLVRKPPSHKRTLPLMSVPTEFLDVMDLAKATLKIALPEKPTELHVEESATLKLGTIEIPVGLLWKLIHGLLLIVPVRHRKSYLRSRINVSLVSLEKETQLIVYTEDLGTSVKPGTVLSRAADVTSLADFGDLLRDAAFMILELHLASFPGRTWSGMSQFIKGMGNLELYMTDGKAESCEAAEMNFRKAIDEDPGSYLGCYFLASLGVAKRLPDSIREAIALYNQALESNELRLPEGSPAARIRSVKQAKALVYAGLAHCYSQQYHRGAKRTSDVLKQIKANAQLAKEYWPKDSPLHPLILHALAFAHHVDEGTPETREETVKNFGMAAEYYLEALVAEPDNAMFHNNLGWVLLKLTEWEVPQISSRKFPKDLSGHPAELSQNHLERSLEIYPANKLADANLCLLYGTNYFRSRENSEFYLERARHYGKQAVELDPTYDNGFRDLASTLIRYSQLEEAYPYFISALKEATSVQKHEEIIADIKSVLEMAKVVDRSELIRWQHPDATNNAASVKAPA
jgi:tetratricopeptide (TPR) repeat protein